MIFLPPFLIFVIVFLSFSKSVLASPEPTLEERMDSSQRLSAALLEYTALKELTKETEQQRMRSK